MWSNASIVVENWATDVKFFDIILHDVWLASKMIKQSYLAPWLAPRQHLQARILLAKLLLQPNKNVSPSTIS